MSNPVLEIKQLTFGHKNPLTSPMSAQLMEGELVAIAGRNGCGKSTLIHSLLGFKRPLSGEVELMGEPIQEMKPQSRATKISAVLTQRFNSAGLSMFDVAALGRQPYTTGMGRLGDDDRALVQRALDQMGIGHLAESRMDEVSDGERQKCMIARALAQETKVIIMDEPLAFLDFPTKLEVLQLLRKLCNEGRSILFSTHELNLIPEIVDGLLVFDQEKVSKIDGDSGELKDCLEKTFGSLTA
jgi:iron complex transport system ATP-binding protein